MTNERRHGDRRKAPAFQLYVKDWLSSERVALMSGCAEGLFVRLLALCWDNGSLPSGELALMALVPKHRRCWKRCWPQVAPCFENRDGRLYNLKLDSQRTRLHDLSVTRAEVGRKGGLQRSNSLAIAKQLCSPAVAVAVEPKTPKPKSPTAGGNDWVPPFASAWRARFGGSPPWGRIGKALKDLRASHPDADILARWERYLAQPEGKYLTPENFAQKFGEWAPRKDDYFTKADIDAWEAEA